MAAFFRIAVALAIIYLARFVMSHKRHAEKDTSDSAYSQSRDSLSVSKGSTEDSKDSSEGFSEDSIESTSERILIKSGVPLRGRTIHHTAWSEEDKISESIEGTKKREVGNGQEEFSDSWSFTKAINYILSFIYDVEDEGVTSSPEPIFNENSKEKLELRKRDSDKLPQKNVMMYNLKGKDGNASIYNNNKGSLLETTPSYLIGYFQNQDIKWFESETGNLKDEDRYSDYQYDDNDQYEESELVYEDSEYETEFSNEAEDESVVEKQKGQLKDSQSKKFEGTDNEIQKTSQKEHSHKRKENEPAFHDEDENNEYIRKKIEEDAVPFNEGTYSNQTSNREIQERQSKTPAITVDNENLLIHTNQGSSEKNSEEITSWSKDNQSSQKKLIQNNRVTFSQMSSSTLKPNTSYSQSKRENPKGLEDNVKSVNSKPKVLIKNETSYGKLNKKNLFYPTVGKDIQKDDNDGEILDTKSLKKRTIKDKPSTSNTIDQKHPQTKKENINIKTKHPDSRTREQYQPKEHRIIDPIPPTSFPQRPPQLKHSRESGNSVRHGKPEKFVVKSNQGRTQPVIHQQATTELRFEKALGDPQYNIRTTTANSIVYTGEKIHQSKIQRNKERVQLPQKKPLTTQPKQSDHQNVKSPRKTINENGTKHSNHKVKKLSDIYSDLEPDENVGSYNYILDSFEFIRIDENNKNKVNKKQNTILVKEEKYGVLEKESPILPTPFIHQSEHQVPDKPKEVFDTILEYLYKNSNSSFLLSLKEMNASES